MTIETFMNNQTNKLSKVIQFADCGDIRRINKGYYGNPAEWNPNNEITLVPIEDLAKLQEKGVVFEQNPSLANGISTFVETVPNKYSCINREEYAPLFMAGKQKLLAEVLNKLVVCKV